MKTIDLYIFDSDKRYLDKLEQYMSTCKDTVFSVKACTKATGRVIRRKGVFLVSEDILSGNEGLFDPERTVVLYDEDIAPGHAGLASIYKYQPADGIYRKLASFCAEVPGLMPGGAYREPGTIDVFGIYSPGGRGDSAGCISALRDRYEDCGGVLCLDLTELPEDSDGRGSLQEVLYRAADPGGKLKLRIAGLVSKRDGVDILDTGSKPLDIRDLAAGAWETLLSGINDHTDYGAVVFIFGMIPTDISVMGLCDEIYVAGDGSSGPSVRTKRFREMLESSGAADTADRITEIAC